MRLIVTTPTAVIVDAPDVHSVRAEDETGAFGILPGHAEFLTALAVSVVTWKDTGGSTHHVAVRGGVLTVSGGEKVEIATRDAVGEDTLERLGSAVLTRFREDAQRESESRISTTRLQLATIRQLHRYLEAGRQAGVRGALPDLEAALARGGPSGEGEAL